MVKQENRKLKDELKKLQEELEKVKKQRDTYKGMIFKPKVTPQDEGKKDGVGKKLGGQTGHQGASRKLPSKIDTRVRVFLKSCPHCQSPLKRAKSFEPHTIEDIPNLEQIRTQVTEYRLERQWCNTCHKEVVAKPALVIPHSRVGLNLIIQILIFKYVCRMTFEVMAETLYQTYGVNLTTGGIIDILKRTKKFLGKDYGELLQAIRSSPLKHADETGWRIKGLNNWLWAVLTKQEVYYTIEETRGKGVAENTLRAIRPAVVIRKISGGSKSTLGAETFAANFSVIQTIRMRNQPLIPTLKELIFQGATGKY